MKVVNMCKQFSRNEFSGEEKVKTFEMFWKNYHITPGDLVRFSESSTEYRFSSVETVIKNGVTWINVHDLKDAFKIKSYHPRHLCGVIRKKSFNG